MKNPGYTFLNKVKSRLWSRIVSYTRESSVYPLIYRSWWHANFFKQKNAQVNKNYFTAIPNRGAGIGHQLSNWISGYWFAQKFELNFAHTPFTSSKWESFLGLGEDEISVEDLNKKHGYKKVLIPLFNETKPDEVALIRKIINSYADQKVIFVAEQDQYYRNQYEVLSDLQRKFYNAKERKNDNLIYSQEYFNIAVHVRRGDIESGLKNNNPNLLMRWQNNNYFESVLSNVINIIDPGKPLAIYLFSQGKKDDFKEFEKFGKINYCLDMGAQESFLHMIFADLLITSKSSFSYKPALFSNGIKVSPEKFWHGYPKSKDWILADEDGTLIDISQNQQFSFSRNAQI